MSGSVKRTKRKPLPLSGKRLRQGWQISTQADFHHWPSPPQLMHPPEPLQVLQLLSPVPRNLPVPLQVRQLPEPPQELQTEELLPEEPPS